MHANVHGMWVLNTEIEVISTNKQTWENDTLVSVNGLKCHDYVFFLYKFSPSNSQLQVQDFIDLISGPHSLYGLQPETLDSLVLSMLPPLKHAYEPSSELRLKDSSLDVKVLLMQELLQNLCHCAGFYIPTVSTCSTRMKAQDHCFSPVH